MLGPIDFDDKGDLTVQNPVWYVWRGGNYMPLEQDTARNRSAEREVLSCVAWPPQSIVMLAATLGAPARADVLIGMAGPMTGKNAWFGEQMERGAALAVADINAAGGVLGQQVQLITADDFCDPEQAVAAAKKLVSDGVIFVAGHYCSHASIPASEIYAAAGVLHDFAGVDQPDVDRAGPCQRFPRRQPRRCGRHHGRQLPGRSLGRQEDRDPPRQHDLWQGYCRGNQETVEPSGRD